MKSYMFRLRGRVTRWKNCQIAFSDYSGLHATKERRIYNAKGLLHISPEFGKPKREYTLIKEDSEFWLMPVRNYEPNASFDVAPAIGPIYKLREALDRLVAEYVALMLEG